MSETKNGERDDGEVNDGKKDGWTEGLTDGRTDRQKLRKKERKTDGRTYVELFHPMASITTTTTPTPSIMIPSTGPPWRQAGAVLMDEREWHAQANYVRFSPVSLSARRSLEGTFFFTPGLFAWLMISARPPGPPLHFLD